MNPPTAIDRPLPAKCRSGLGKDTDPIEKVLQTHDNALTDTTQKCLHCGRPIIWPRKGKIYCSTSCRVMGCRKRKREAGMQP